MQFGSSRRRLLLECHLLGEACIRCIPLHRSHNESKLRRLCAHCLRYEPPLMSRCVHARACHARHSFCVHVWYLLTPFSLYVYYMSRFYAPIPRGIRATSRNGRKYYFLISFSNICSRRKPIAKCAKDERQSYSYSYFPGFCDHDNVYALPTSSKLLPIKFKATSAFQAFIG